MNSTPNKILVIRLSSIGDVILTNPVITQLRKKYPDAKIDFLVRMENADMIRFHPELSEIYKLDKSKGSSEIRRLREILQQRNYDVILDLQFNARSLRLTGGTNSRVYRIRKNQFIRFLLVHFKINLYRRGGRKPLRVTQKYLRTASPLGVATDSYTAELHLSDQAYRRGDRWWGELNKLNFGVLMAPGARHFTKRWPPEYYASLIRLIYETYKKKTVLVGGPDEVSIIDEIREHAGTEITESYAGKISLMETCGLIKNAPYFISNDSALMHVAAAFRIPQVALFGSTVEEFGFFPVNDLASVFQVEHLSCRPCTHIGRSSCPRGHFRCLTDIPPESILHDLIGRNIFKSNKDKLK